ncbi:MAG: hypothetical protein IJ011_06565 [Clostridia bacterium]|nr:hypothetical protein [Clostridia bacterium]
MISLFFIVPVVVFLLSEIFDFKKYGIKNRLKSVGFWLSLFGTLVFSTAALMLLFMSFTAFMSFSLIKLLACALSAVFFAVTVKLIRYLKTSQKIWSAALVAVVIALFLESTVFNFRFYQTYDYKETDFTEDYGTQYFTKTENEREYKRLSKNMSPCFVLSDIDCEVNNVYFDVTTKNSYGEVVNSYVQVYMTDESNENYLKLPAQTVMTDIEETKYLNLVTNGVTEKLKFSISTDYGETFTVNSIRINVRQSFSFKIIRFAAVALIIFIAYILRPKSKLWSYVFTGSSRQKAVICAVIVVEVAALMGITFFNPIFQRNPASHTAQYQQLAEAFLDGRLYLAQEPPEYLAEMENPYDYAERVEQKNKHGESYYWDAAYYNGKYYVYFGVVPVLLTYLPYRAITGNAMPNVMAIRIFMVFFVVGSFLLIYELLKRYFKYKKIPFLSYILTCLIFVNASGGVFIAKRPDFYSVPILSGLAFTVFGLYFWLISLKKEGRVHAGYAALGSLCMALVAGCRPQLLVVSAFAFLFFWNAVFKERSLFSKKGFWSTFTICLPYVLVAAGIMWYNNARFGSPFDFGQNYNLTTNDMTGRGYRVERVGLSLFTYFFQLPNFTAAFPFLQPVDIDTNYLGVTITEPMFGGIFAVIPLLWCLALVPMLAKKMKKGHILALCLLPLSLSIFLGAFDAQGAGLLQRYVSDFSFLAVLAAIVVVFYVYQGMRGRLRQYVNGFLGFASFASGIYCFLIIFAKYSVELFYRSPYLFNYVSELVQFW